MKKGLMTQFPYARGRAYVCKNIGDYIQAVATRQFVDKIDEYIEQEEADNYFPEDKRPIRLIMNGWYQWRSENWPPSEYIVPLLVSMHISPLKADDLLNPEGIAFFRKFGPVGCRDYYTKELLDSKGIPAYFSGCMTLTLGKKYSIPKKGHQGVCIVDPYFDIPSVVKEVDGKRKYNIRNIIKGISAFLKHAPSAIQLAKNDFFKVYSPTGFLDRNVSKWRSVYKAALFYKTYSRKFSHDLLVNATYITHWIDVKMDGSVTNDDLLDIAEKLVKQYASANLVITSRTHAGLPCLGLGTPVVFIANREVVSENGTFNTPGRLGGLIELFRVLTLEKEKFGTDDDVFAKIPKFDMATDFENKRDWSRYADELDRKATEFMK